MRSRLLAAAAALVFVVAVFGAPLRAAAEEGGGETGGAAERAYDRGETGDDLGPALVTLAVISAGVAVVVVAGLAGRHRADGHPAI